MKTLTLLVDSTVAVLGGLLFFTQAAQARGFDCLIVPNQIVEIRSPIEGLIGKNHVERGGFVRKGQLLLELQSDVEHANVAAAKHRSEMVGRISTARNRVEYTSKKLERMQELLSQNFVSHQARDDAQTEKRLAESELKDALENQEQARLDHRRATEVLNQRFLRSPFDGIVMERLLNVGELAEAGTGRKALIKLAQVNPLRVEVLLSQKEYGRVSVGSEATVIPEGLGNSFPARVTIVDKVIDAASGMFGVRLELANPKGLIPGGIHCKAELPGL